MTPTSRIPPGRAHHVPPVGTWFPSAAPPACPSAAPPAVREPGGFRAGRMPGAVRTPAAGAVV